MLSCFLFLFVEGEKEGRRRIDTKRKSIFLIISNKLLNI